jgi:hypothetical protein
MFPLAETVAVGTTRLCVTVLNRVLFTQPLGPVTDRVYVPGAVTLITALLETTTPFASFQEKVAPVVVDVPV